MQYVHLGRTGLKVSRLGLGTMNFGDVSDETASFEIMDTAFEAGINFIDTADVYGGPQRPDIERGYGRSEEIIGRWMHERQARDKIVLATKLFQPMGYGPNDRRLSAYHIRKACEDSLRRLKTDRIDLYQMHHIDRFTMGGNLAGFRAAGAAGEGALCRQQQFRGMAHRHGTRRCEFTPFPWAGVGAKPVQPGESHHRAGSGAGVPPPRCWRDPVEPPGRRFAGRCLRQGKLEAYEALCRELGEHSSDVALAWLLHNPAVTAPIIGPRTKEQLAANLRAVDISLSSEVLRRLDEIWPGPGGEAPEAYAW